MGGTVADKMKTIAVYSDYKSPYAFLAKDFIYELEDQCEVEVEWLPYTLDIPSYLGSARLDERGEIVESARNAHQWRRVRYSYIDCRRQARKRGLVILERAKYGTRLSPQSACFGRSVKVKASCGPTTIESLNAFGGVNLTLKIPKRLPRC
jgi:2-hydroxychromene-2-carboxylate isomerase